MKKLVLLLILVFGFVSSTNANQENNLINQSYDNSEFVEDHCWEIAEAVEAVYCGYVGCDYDWFEYVFEICENTLKKAE